MTYESENFELWLKGSSRDLRTNTWSVTCKKCKKTHEPPTTILRFQTLQCKCGETESVDYNNLKEKKL